MTEFYRALINHLATTDDRFIMAPGVRGMVMSVFTLPGFNTVFKIIKDRFSPSKNVDRATVIEKYRLVKSVDRVGRMADTQEFADFRFPLSKFEPACLEELLEVAPSTVSVEGDTVLAPLDESRWREVSGCDAMLMLLNEEAGYDKMIGAMGLESFARRLEACPSERLLVVVGDRQDLEVVALLVGHLEMPGVVRDSPDDRLLAAGDAVVHRLVLGVVARDSGSISLLGQDPATAGAELRSRVGVMLQDGGLPPSARPVPLLRHIAGLLTPGADPVRNRSGANRHPRTQTAALRSRGRCRSS
mgnify:CR=1 FL=1